jgi:glycosyltransferase involved in cell wall biosynthesis
MYTRAVLDALFTLPTAHDHQFYLWLSGAALTPLPDWLIQYQRRWNYSNVHWCITQQPNKWLTSQFIMTGRPSWQRLFEQTIDVVWMPNLAFAPTPDRITPVVCTVHDLSFERYSECLTLKGKLRHHFIRPRQLLQHAAGIIAVSEHTRRDLVELYGISESAITMVHSACPASTEGTALEKQSISHPHNTSDTITILCISTIEPRKNIDGLLDAFVLLHQDYPATELVVIGGPGWKSHTTQQRLRSTPGVRWLEYVDETTKADYLRTADIFVYPSIYEGFGFPPLEAQAAGVPVIVGNHSSLPEVVGDGAMFVNVMNLNSIRRALESLVTDTHLRQQLISAGFQNLQRFHWTQTATNTLHTIIQSI